MYGKKIKTLDRCLCVYVCMCVKEKESRSKRFYDTGRRRDITPRRSLRIGKASEFPHPLVYLPSPSRISLPYFGLFFNYVSFLFFVNLFLMYYLLALYTCVHNRFFLKMCHSRTHSITLFFFLYSPNFLPKSPRLATMFSFIFCLFFLKQKEHTCFALSKNFLKTRLLFLRSTL